MTTVSPTGLIYPGVFATNQNHILPVNRNLRLSFSYESGRYAHASHQRKALSGARP